MNQNDIHKLIEKQRAYFYSNETLNIEKRIHALKKLKTCIQKNEAEIATALEADLGKSNFESYMCETGLVLSEISYMLKGKLEKGINQLGEGLAKIPYSLLSNSGF